MLIEIDGLETAGASVSEVCCWVYGTKTEKYQYPSLVRKPHNDSKCIHTPAEAAKRNTSKAANEELS